MKNTSAGSPIPKKTHLLLLKAALLTEAKKKHFAEWRNAVDFENEVESASFRLLPLLYLNVKDEQLSDPVIARLKGIYRKRWSESNLFFYKVKPILAHLQQNNIRVMLLKGIPLALQYYKNLALRPMADADVMIPVAQRETAIKLLTALGFSIKEQAPLDFLLQNFRSVTLVKENLEIDLHWAPLMESYGIKSEMVFWHDAIACNFLELDVEALSATDQLFHTIVHGFRFNPEPPIRWIADAVTILRSNNAIDWDRFWTLTKMHKVNLQVKEALVFLKTEFNVFLPEGFYAYLLNYKGSMSEKILFKNAITQGWQFEYPNTFSKTVRMHYFIHLRLSTQKSFFNQNLAFLGYTTKLITSTPAHFFSRFFHLFVKMLTAALRAKTNIK